MKLLKCSTALGALMLLGAWAPAADADMTISTDDAPAWVAGVASIADGSAPAYVQDAEEECDDEDDEEEDDDDDAEDEDDEEDDDDDADDEEDDDDDEEDECEEDEAALT